jgi:hypothetical protein
VADEDEDRRLEANDRRAARAQVRANRVLEEEDEPADAQRNFSLINEFYFIF